MRSHFALLVSLMVVFLNACSHNETTHGTRTPSSDPHYNLQSSDGSPVWENDVCVLKGESKAQDFIIRFSDVHSTCPALRDYNPAGAAYSKMKSLGRGVHLPACRPQPAQVKVQAPRCWMGFDVFGQSLGSCALAAPQPACTACQCDGRNGISWAN